MMLLTLKDLLPPEWEAPSFAPFRPCVSYSAPLDTLTYLTQDASVRVKVIDEFLSILLHPYEDLLMGVKIHQVGFLCAALQAALRSVTGKDMSDIPNVPLGALMDLALTMQIWSKTGAPSKTPSKGPLRGLTKIYDLARGCADGVTFDGALIDTRSRVS